jgi:hypothetical protein
VLPTAQRQIHLALLLTLGPEHEMIEVLLDHLQPLLELLVIPERVHHAPEQAAQQLLDQRIDLSARVPAQQGKVD